MRTFALATVATVALLAVSAAAAAPPTTTLKVSTYQVRYGTAVKLVGRTSGHTAGTAVTILARPISASQLRSVATVKTSTGGRWSYATKPGVATTYKARTGGATSRGVLIGVRPAISVRVAGNGAVVAHVGAGRSLRGRFVELQHASGAHWTTFAKRSLDQLGNVTFSGALVPKGAPRLRVAMSVNEAGVGLLGGFSAPLTYRQLRVSLVTPASKVLYGGSLVLSGKASAKETTLQVLARPVVRAEFEPVASVHTNAGGRFTYRVKPPSSTAYEVRDGNATSRAVTIGVVPALTARLLSGDRVSVHVSLPKSLAGRTIQIQKLASGRWHTITRGKLNAKATAVFTPAALPGGTSTLRAAISVNQVGAGFLGSLGRAFTYRR